MKNKKRNLLFFTLGLFTFFIVSCTALQHKIQRNVAQIDESEKYDPFAQLQYDSYHKMLRRLDWSYEVEQNINKFETKEDSNLDPEKYFSELESYLFLVNSRMRWVTNKKKHEWIAETISRSMASIIRDLENKPHCNRFKRVLSELHLALFRTIEEFIEVHHAYHEKFRTSLTVEGPRTNLKIIYLVLKNRIRILADFIELTKDTIITYQENDDFMKKADNENLFDFMKYCKPNNFPNFLHKLYGLSDLIHRYTSDFNAAGPTSIKREINYLKNIRRDHKNTQLFFMGLKIAGAVFAIHKTTVWLGISLWSELAIEGTILAGTVLFLKYELEITSYIEQFYSKEFMHEIESFTEENKPYKQNIDTLIYYLENLLARETNEHEKVKLTLQEYRQNEMPLQQFCSNIKDSMVDIRQNCKNCFQSRSLPKVCQLDSNN